MKRTVLGRFSASRGFIARKITLGGYAIAQKWFGFNQEGRHPADFCRFYSGNNYISYLLRKSTCKKPHNKKYQKQLCRSYSINEDSNLSSTLSEISTKENLCLNESQINLSDEYDEYGYRLSLNNIIEGEQDFKTYYRYNSNIIGKKHPRYFFEENSELSSFDEDNNNINEKFKDEMWNSFPRKNKNKKKKSKISLLNKEKNIKDVRRLSNEFSSYKNKLKFQDNINNRFLKQIETNEKKIGRAHV